MRNQRHEQILKAVIESCPDFVAYVNKYGDYESYRDWQVTFDSNAVTPSNGNYAWRTDTVLIVLRYGTMWIRLHETVGRRFNIEFYIEMPPIGGSFKVLNGDGRSRTKEIKFEDFSLDKLGRYYASIQKSFMKALNDVNWANIQERMVREHDVEYRKRLRLSRTISYLQIGTMGKRDDKRLIQQLYGIMTAAGMIPKFETLNNV